MEIAYIVNYAVESLSEKKRSQPKQSWLSVKRSSVISYDYSINGLVSFSPWGTGSVLALAGMVLPDSAEI